MSLEPFQSRTWTAQSLVGAAAAVDSHHRLLASTSMSDEDMAKELEAPKLIEVAEKLLEPFKATILTSDLDTGFWGPKKLFQVTCENCGLKGSRRLLKI